MEPQINTDVLLMIGRVEGKVDSLISLSSAQAQRIDALETRQSKTEVDVATLKSAKSQSHSILTHVTAIFAVLVSVVSAYFSVKH